MPCRSSHSLAKPSTHSTSGSGSGDLGVLATGLLPFEVVRKSAGSILSWRPTWRARSSPRYISRRTVDSEHVREPCNVDGLSSAVAGSEVA
jgi:hypothetical protein